jgi:hypothetical protein
LRYFLEAMLRVSDLPGTTVLMLAFAMALGSVAEFVVGFWYLKRDFALATSPLTRLSFESLSAAMIGGAVSYGVLSATGSYLNINTLTGVALQGFLAGLAGLVITAAMLVLLKNQEIFEAYAAFKKHFAAPAVALEPTDVSS